MTAGVMTTIVGLVIVIITLLISWLVLTLLIRVVKASIIAAIGIAAVVLFLQLAFGISPLDIWQYIIQSFQNTLRFVMGR